MNVIGLPSKIGIGQKKPEGQNGITIINVFRKIYDTGSARYRLLIHKFHPPNLSRRRWLEAFGAVFVDNAVVKDRNLITSTGPGTGIEVAFELLTLLTSVKNANHIRSLMRIPEPSPGWQNTPQVNS